MARSDAAASLRKILVDPIYNKTLRKEVGRGELDYEVYLRTRELLALQTPDDELVVPDELLFQVMHQTQELWLKAAAFETANVVEHLDTGDVFAALASLDVIVNVTRVLAEQIRVLFTLSPSRFQIIRRSLGNGSGLESPGYNQLLAGADFAYDALQRFIANRGADLFAVYSEPHAHADTHQIAERFVDWDGNVQTWRVEHFMLVRRTIGIDKSVHALDGFPTVALGARMTKPLFPDLWSVRVTMTQAWSRDGGFLPGEERGPAVEAVSTPRKQTEELPPLPKPDLRAEFPVLATCVYLNSNSAGAAPRAARATLDAYWRTIEQWRDEHWEQWWEQLGVHANKLAVLIGGTAGSVVCDANVTTLFGRVMSAFDYRTRPRVVTSDLEFPSIPFVIRAFERYGAEPVVVPSTDGVAIDVEAMVRAIDERTQLVCVSHATFATGAVTDLAPIVARARQVGAHVLVDAYQTVGAMPVDVGALDIDFLLAGSHKWLCGSYEHAFLYVRPALTPFLKPAATGWIASEDPLSFAPPSNWAADSRRFAGGTPAVLPMLFSRPGLAIIESLRVDVIRAQSLARTDRIIARADDAGLTVLTPRPHIRRGGIVALRFANDRAVARKLVAGGFVCSFRDGLRIAPHFYNTEGEIERFMDALIAEARASS